MTTGRPLRVALFAEQGHPEGSFRSGVTRLTDNLVQRCMERGDVTLEFFTYHQHAGTDGVPPLRYHRVTPRMPAAFHGLHVDALDIAPFANPRFVDAARGCPFDVVLGTSPGIGTQGQLLARARGVPFAAVYTTDLPHYAESLVRAGLGPGPGADLAGAAAGKLAWRYLRWLYGRRRTDLVLLPTEAARREFLAVVDASTAVLGRGADTLAFPEVQRSVGGPVKLLYVGRIDYGQKNLGVLEQVLRSVPGTVLWVVGDGDDLPLMRRRLVEEERAGRVVFTGRVDDPARLTEIYLSADVFVFPSLFDTLGQVVLEAQRAGLPVVVRDRGGPPELVVAGRTGFVSEDDRAFARDVSALVADPELRRTMGRSAKAHADALPTWSRVTDRLVEHLEALATRGQALSAL
jgi:glycosyltransferase involved in cell wall biosynthesis